MSFNILGVYGWIQARAEDSNCDGATHKHGNRFILGDGTVY